MINSITLTSSMRSNLMSLKNIASQMSKTQNILATGKKVNSAIDNAINYYQARSLSNRAADLNNLLDSMSQGIMTIQAATQGLDNAYKYLEQAKSLANQALEQNNDYKISMYEYISKQATIVTSANEFINAINSNTDTICIFGTIDLGEITETIQINNNKKIVGVEYFGYEDSDIDKFSTIKATSSKNISLIQTNNVDCVFSDLTINYVNQSHQTTEIATIMAEGGNIDNNNININFEVFSNTAGYGRSCIMGRNSAVINTSGVNFLNAKGSFTTYGYRVSSASINLNGVDNISTTGELGRGIVSVGGTINVNNELFINTEGNGQQFLYGNVNFSNTSKTTLISKNITYPYITMDGKASFNQGAKFAIGTKENDLKYYEINENININAPQIQNFIASSYTSEAPLFELHNIPVNKDIHYTLDDKVISVNPTVSIQYQAVINAYNNIIYDSSYQGINLLTGEELTVTFNERRTHKLSIKGKDIRSEKIGIKSREWQTKDDVYSSINEISDAINKIRNFQAELGNNLSIIQTRQNFTESLSDVLETGADDLVLADMNEASAEYLMLQTRQQLAVNSLSLASQAAQSVLSLF